jgi:superfamily II DNA/RNA helicase
MYELIDTRERGLVERVAAEMLLSQTVDLAVGLALIGELAELFVHAPNLKKVRVLLGNNADRQDIARIIEAQVRPVLAQESVDAERLAGGKQQIQQRAARLREWVRRSLSCMAQTDVEANAVQRLLLLLENGELEVRAYLRERLPQDSLLTGRSSGETVAIFGNGSLLAPDLSADAGLWLKGNATKGLQQRFSEWWGYSVPFTEPLREELGRSWAAQQTTPYLLYLSILYRLVADRLLPRTEENDDWLRDLPPLTDFQQVAVRQALSILNQQSGVFVADVVGLGKTYIGTAMLKRLTLQGLRATIFCPPSLEPMWQEMNDVYGLAAKVMSTGRLAQYGDAELQLPEYQTPDRQIVLIDESHRFRNQNTASYRALSGYTMGRQCILLTATPYSLRPEDVYRQIRLFADDDLDLGLNPPRLSEYFNRIRPESDSASLVEVMRPLLIRRTRRHIQKHYPDASISVPKADGTMERRKLIFPIREKPEVLRYDVESVFGSEKIYDYIVAKLGVPTEETELPPDYPIMPMTYARYGLHAYVLNAFKEKKPYNDLKQTGRAVRGFIRILLFKRLESSVYAFRQTVDTLLRVHENFLRAVNAGRVPAGDQAQRLLYEQEWDDEAALETALSSLDEKHARYAADAFDLPRLRSDLENDIDVLAELKALLTPITPDKDGKLHVLRDLLNRTLAGQKVLVFTQYEATGTYLAENLADMPQLAFLSGRHRTAGRSFMQTVARFAPKANPRFVQPGAGTINTLIATDVLSEGLNLQDCSCLVNYDLHFNPVRLIQRVGRVDRVGSEAEIIRLFNFLPERNVEKFLHLEDILKKRISDIHAFVGEDNAILHPNEQLNEKEMYAAYTASLEQEESAEAGIDYTEIEERIRNLQQEQPELFAQLRDLPGGVRTARRARNGKAGTFACFTTDDGFDILEVRDARGKVIYSRPEDILALLECEATEQTLPLPSRYNTQISQAFADFEQTAARRRTDRRTGPRLATSQRYALKLLDGLVTNEEREERRTFLGQIDKALKARLPEAALRELNRLRRLDLPASDAVQRLERIYHDLDLGRYVRRDEDIVRNPVARIVCSEAFV